MPTSAVEDKLAIEALFVRYTTALDSGDVNGVVGCFIETGKVESPIVGRFEGRDELLKFARITADAITRGAKFRHVVSNFNVEVWDDDHAKAKCYLLDFVTRDGKTELLSPGEYECELVKIGDKWLFASRIVRMDRQFPIP